MRDILVLAIKGLAGGTLVLAFALLSESLSPKRFAGLFSAAPAVALVGLTVALLDKGVSETRHNALGMVAGGVAMAAYASVVVPLLRRHSAAAAAALGLGAWALVAAIAVLPVVLA